MVTIYQLSYVESLLTLYFQVVASLIRHVTRRLGDDFKRS
jgi:hypothetical protein